MKVILAQDVKNLGKRGQVVDVAEGYARNYLMPRGLVQTASAANLRAADTLVKAQARKVANELADARRAAERLSGLSITVRTRAGDEGRLFGSVTPKDIAAALVQVAGVNIDRRRIELREPIKHVGKHQVTVRVHPEVTATLEVVVQGEDGDRA